MDLNIRPEEHWIEKFDEVFYDMFGEHKYKNYVLPGGRGSTKSSFFSQMIVLLLMSHPKCHAAVFRKVGNTLKTSVLGQIQWAIDDLGLNDYFVTHVNPMEIIYKPTGQKILFFGLDDAGKIKSVKLPFGYIGITWWEELDQFSGEAEVRKVMQSTQRGGDEYWNLMSFNPPISQSNWANEYVTDIETLRTTDSLVIHSCYLDVPKDWLGQAFFDEAEYVKVNNNRAYQNEYLGLAIGSGGNVFPNVEAIEITDEMISNFEYVYNGLDWGYANDPNAYTKVAYDAKHNNIYLFGEHYAVGESDQTLWEELYERKSWNKKVVDSITYEEHYEPSPFMEVTENITADNSETKSIGWFRSKGAYMRPVKKFPNSIVQGVKWMQSQAHIYIDPKRCPEAYREFSRYEYVRDRDGKVTSQYPDEDNHFIDSLRYALSPVWQKRQN